MNIVVFCGSAAGMYPVYAEVAAEFGARIAKEGHRLIYGGGYVGMMGAASNAAIEGGARVTGLIPEFMFERDWANPDVSEMIVTEDMDERKLKMLKLGDVYVALPGGTGTLEEIAQAIAWAGLGLIKGDCFFLNTNGFYDHLEAFFRTMHDEGFVRASNAANVRFVRTVDELFECLD